VLTEQFVLGILVGTLSIATPSIVGAATPSFAPWVFGIICYIAGAVQILGFIGVSKEKPILYRRYVTLHILLTLAAFGVAAAWAIISATRHSSAKSQCLSNFFPFADPNDTGSEGAIMCEIFPWVDVGIMGGLWVLFAIVQIYFYVLLSSYGTSQDRVHEKFAAGYDATAPLTANDIPLHDRDPVWDSTTAGIYNDPNHLRSGSQASVSTVLAEPVQREADYHADYHSAIPNQRVGGGKLGGTQGFSENYYSAR